MRRETAGILAVAAVVAATRIGASANPSPNHPRTAAWYRRLSKPSYTPPGAAIGAVWTGLDTLLCVAGYRLMSAPPSPARNTALGLWGANVAGLGGWPWLFFGRKQLGTSLVTAGGLLAAAVGSVASAARVDRIAAAAGVPLVAWLGFATLLNEEIWRRN